MILSDFDLSNAIKGRRLIVKPFHKESIRENGLDLRLDNEMARHKEFDSDYILDPTKEEHVKGSYSVQKKLKEIVINGNEQVLLSTYEYLGMPDDLMGFVELRSTWARHGLSLPPTIIDAGFQGNITLEVINKAPYKIKLRPGQRFAHIIFAKTTSRVSNAYSGKYNGQRGVRLPKVIS